MIAPHRRRSGATPLCPPVTHAILAAMVAISRSSFIGWSRPTALLPARGGAGARCNPAAHASKAPGFGRWPEGLRTHPGPSLASTTGAGRSRLPRHQHPFQCIPDGYRLANKSRRAEMRRRELIAVAPG
jgi:hypothetical protein